MKSDDWCYPHNGSLYPRVTRMLEIIRNPGLESWRGRVGDAEADRVASKAAKLGQRCHRAILATLTGKKVKVPAGEVGRVFETWRRWYDAQVDFRPSRVEQRLFGEAPFNYAGTSDCIEDGIVGGRNRITDWKFTGQISAAHWIQLHAYVPLAWPELARARLAAFDSAFGGGSAPQSPHPSAPTDTDLASIAAGYSSPASPPWPPVVPAVDPLAIRLRIVRIDPFLGLFEEQERAFDVRVLATFMKLADVYRAWFFAPRIQAEQGKFELIAEKGDR